MKIYWDIQNHVFLRSNTDSQEIQRLDWALRDQVSVTLYILAPTEGSQGYTIQEAPAGYAVKFAIKPALSLDAGNLVYQGTWTLSGAGTGATYPANVNLNTEELIAALSAVISDDYLDLVGEFTLQDSSGNQRDSSQVSIRILRDVIRITDPAPISAASPWFQEFVHSGSNCIRIVNSDGTTLAVFCPPGVTYP
jgi:hypothetical protein